MKTFKEFIQEKATNQSIKVFDVDDTLTFTDSKIRYREPGKDWIEITTDQFATKREKLHKETESFIVERKQRGTLYHITSISSMENILKTDEFRKHASRKFLSLTRDRNYSGWDRNKHQVRLFIDGDKLSDNYKIRPYKDNAVGSNKEREEGIDASVVKNFRKYIQKIDILYHPDEHWNPNAVKDGKKEWKELQKKYRIAITYQSKIL